MTVFDGNLSIETMETILEVAMDYNKPVFFEPTDMRIAEKPFLLPAKLIRQIKFASPNLYELRSIAKYLGYTEASNKKSLDPAFIDESEQGILTEVMHLVSFLSDKIDNLVVTLGNYLIKKNLIIKILGM